MYTILRSTVGCIAIEHNIILLFQHCFVSYTIFFHRYKLFQHNVCMPACTTHLYIYMFTCSYTCTRIHSCSLMYIHVHPYKQSPVILLFLNYSVLPILHNTCMHTKYNSIPSLILVYTHVPSCNY